MELWKTYKISFFFQLGGETVKNCKLQICMYLLWISKILTTCVMLPLNLLSDELKSKIKTRSCKSAALLLPRETFWKTKRTDPQTYSPFDINLPSFTLKLLIPLWFIFFFWFQTNFSISFNLLIFYCWNSEVTTVTFHSINFSVACNECCGALWLRIVNSLREGKRFKLVL